MEINGYFWTIGVCVCVCDSGNNNFKACNNTHKATFVDFETVIRLVTQFNNKIRILLIYFVFYCVTLMHQCRSTTRIADLMAATQSNLLI